MKVVGIILIVMLLALVVLILYSALVVASREEELMSVDKWAYNKDVCDGNYCCGDCDLCDIPKNPEKYFESEEE